MNEIRSRRIDASSRTQSVQLPISSGLRDFDLTLEGEFVRKLSGKLDSDGAVIGELGAIVASDAVSFKSETDLNHVRNILEGMLRDVSDREAHGELLFVDSLEPIPSTASIAEQLEKRLVKDIFAGIERTSGAAIPDVELDRLDQYLLEFSPPDGIDINKIDKVFVQRGNSPTSDDIIAISELTMSGIRSALSELRCRFGRAVLRNVKLIAYGDDGEPVSQMQPLKNWLVFEAGDGTNRYILTLGRWFALAQDYTTKLNKDLEKIKMVTSELKLPTWPSGMSEGEYNELVDDTYDDYVLLDKVDIRPGDGDEVEACDLLYRKGHLIHVKRYSGSQTLSHLFAQGSVSAQLLSADETYRANFLKEVKNREPGFVEIAEGCPTIVVYAIGLPGSRKLPEDLPSFSKVNLRDHARRLRLSKVKPTLCRIQIDAMPNEVPG
jgi:uncharacterized protein (TIGR04141 family)